MHQTWQFNGFEFSAPVPANVEPFVACLGIDGAAALLLALGGSGVAFPQNSTHADAIVAGIVGKDKACALGKALGKENMRVPVARTFLCRHLKGQGRSVEDIARTVRLSNVAVRGHICGRPRANAPTPNKVPLDAVRDADKVEAS